MPVDGTVSHGLERIYPYAAQSQGYYSGCVMNTDYASLQNTNLHYFLSGALSKIRMTQMLTDYDSVFQPDLVSYCNGKKNVFIYGAGTYGIKVADILRQNGISIRGFVVSDEQQGQQEKAGYRVYRLSEIGEHAENMGMIISVGHTQVRREILQNIKEKGYEDYYLL